MNASPAVARSGSSRARTEWLAPEMFDAAYVGSIPNDQAYRDWIGASGAEVWCRDHMDGAAVSFLSAPWFVLENTSPIRRIFELASRYYADGRLTPRINSTVLDREHVTSDTGLILGRFNVRIVFSPGLFEPDLLSNCGIRIIPMPSIVADDVEPPGPNVRRDIPLSFVGCITNPIRVAMATKLAGVAQITLWRNGWHYLVTNAALRAERRRVFVDSLQRSQFVLCPVGESPYSVRFYEAMAAGAVPILISDDRGEWLPEWDWDRTCPRLPWRRFKAMSTADFKAWFESEVLPQSETYAAGCAEAYSWFRKERLKDYIAKALAESGCDCIQGATESRDFRPATAGINTTNTSQP